MRRIIFAAKSAEHSSFLPGAIAGYLAFSEDCRELRLFFVELAFMTKA